MFWLLTFDGNVINYTVKKNDGTRELYEGLIIFNDKPVIPEEMTTNTLFFMQETILKIKQAKEKDLYSSSTITKVNENYEKSINYLENAIKVANGLDDIDDWDDSNSVIL